MINFNVKKNKENNGFTHQNFLKKISGGFTLVETLVALFIFSVSILSVMLALSRGISSTIYAKDKMVAGYLSQEGIEYFRNMRDTFQLYAPNKNDGWPLFIKKLEIAGCMDKGCYFDNNEANFFGQSPTTDISFYPCEDKCRSFLYEPKTGKYYYNDGAESAFSRKMSVELLDDNNIKIISEVTYNAGTNTSTVSLSENLSNWIE